MHEHEFIHGPRRSPHDEALMRLGALLAADPKRSPAEIKALTSELYVKSPVEPSLGHTAAKQVKLLAPAGSKPQIHH